MLTLMLPTSRSADRSRASSQISPGSTSSSTTSFPTCCALRSTSASIVRVPLHGRRVRGWVTEVDPASEVDPSRLQPIAHVSSRGPAAELIDLAPWASVRWAAGRLRPFLVAASPPTNVTALPAPVHGRADVPASSVARRTAEVLAAGGGLLLLPPAVSPLDAILASATRGRTLVAMPTVGRAEAMAAALIRRGLGVAVVPQSVGPRRRRCRRGDRRPWRGVGTVSRAGRGHRDR